MTSEAWDVIAAVMPSIITGLLIGVTNYFKEFAHDETKPNFRRFIGVFLSGGAICGISFAILHELASFEYLTTIGISAAVAFFGVEKTFEYLQNFFQRGVK